MRTRFILICLSLPGPALLGGCASEPASSSHVVKLDTAAVHDTDRARTLNSKAVGFIERADYNAAADVLKQAVTADPEFGPAQNNLGVAYYKQSKMYLSAQQFLLAAALMPRDPEPRNGLGLVFESSNRFEDAVSYYDRARALQPQSLEYLGNAARARVRRGDRNEETRELLTRIANEDDRADWNRWARATLKQMSRPAASQP